MALKMFTAGLLTSLFTSSLAQTPSGIVGTPPLNETFGVSFNTTNSTIDVSPGLMIPIPDAAEEPTISYQNATANSTYMVVMIDYSLPAARVFPNETDFGSLVPGIGENRTTRLHWWQGNFTLASADEEDGNATETGSLVRANVSGPGAYQGPMPPENDTAHIYTLFLFNQPENFTLTPVTANGSTIDLVDVPRANFSLSLVTEQTGDPIAANYFLTAFNTTAVSNSTMEE